MPDRAADLLVLIDRLVPEEVRGSPLRQHI